MRRDYLIAILLAVAALPAGATLMVAPDYLHLTGIAVPLTFWGGIGLTLSLMAVAAWVAYRGTRKDAKPRISPFAHMAHDISLLDAIWRVHMGKWGERKLIPHKKIEKWTPEVRKFSDACIQIRQRAFEGLLPIWAQRKKSSLYEPLPLDFWLNRELLPNIMMTGWSDVWVNFTHALAVGDVPRCQSTEWNGFLTNKARVDALWPLDKGVDV